MKESLFADASQRLQEAFKYVTMSDVAIEHLKFPKSCLTVSIPVRMDNGDLKVFQGYRVRYDDTRGQTKVGNIILLKNTAKFYVSPYITKH